jgi:hypothetical protein
MLVLFLVLCLHLLFGLACARMAQRARIKAEPWFVAGTLMGGFAILAFLFLERHRPV